MFGSLENKRKRREREKSKTLTKLRDFIYKKKNLPKDFSSNFFFSLLLRVTKWEGAYIGHPMYENTIKPNILAKLKDKRVIHQKMKSVGINYKSMTRQ